MKYHVFQIEDINCVVNTDTADIYSVSEEVAGRIRMLEIKSDKDLLKNNLRDEEKIEELLECRRLTLNITSKCNLACRYCYANCGDYKQENNEQYEITLETVENAVRKTIELYPEGIRVIQIFGGEPLMAKDKIEDIINKIKQICLESDVQIPAFGMVTNGTLIDEKTAEFLVNNLSSITISLDGNEAVNDFNRRFPGEDGTGVYNSVKQAVQLLKQKNENFHVKCECTVTAANIRDYLEHEKQDNLYQVIFKEIGFDSCLCNPVFGSDDKDISLDTFDMELVKEYFDQFLCLQLHNEHGKLKTATDLYYISKILLKKVSARRQCGANSNDLAIDIRGDIYTCFMFIGESKFKLGNVNQSSIEEIKERYKDILLDLQEANDNMECNSCWARRFCSASYGNCIGARYLANGSVQKPITQSCEIGKKLLERYIWETVRYQKEK